MEDQTSTRLKGGNGEDKSSGSRIEPTKVKKLNGKYPGFFGKEGLPKDVRLDKHGKVHAGGSYQYSVRRTGETAELIGHYRNGKGHATRLIRVLHPMKKTDEGRKHKGFLKELIAHKVPGTEAFQYIF